MMPPWRERMPPPPLSILLATLAYGYAELVKAAREREDEDDYELLTEYDFPRPASDAPDQPNM